MVRGGQDLDLDPEDEVMKIRINSLVHKKFCLENAAKSLTKQIKVTDDARSESYALVFEVRKNLRRCH